MAYTRRGLLAVSGTILGLSGCLGYQGGSGGTPAPSQTPTPEHGAGDQHEEGSHEGGEHQAGELAHEPAENAEVAMVTTEDGSGYHFEPHVVWVRPGGTVSWTLESGTHSATAYHPDNDRPLRMPDEATAWDSGLLTEQGASFDHTFEIEGVYDYYCIPHEALGMVGSVLVGRPDTQDQPGLAAPQSDLPPKARTELEERNTIVRELLDGDHDEG